MGRFARRGSPRTYRAWPLAWPSPSGPLGWQRLRRSRAGPEDRFCEAIRNDLQVPLTLEGPARTMRGIVPALVAVRRSLAIGALGASSSARPWCWRPRQRDTAGTAAAGHRGCRARQPSRLVGFRPKGAAKSCRPATARPQVGPWPLTAGHPGRSFLLNCSRPFSLFTAWAVRPGAPEVRP
jgi:hypothetical protein